MSDPMAAVRKDIRARLVGVPIVIVVLVFGLYVLLFVTGSLVAAIGLTVAVIVAVRQLRRGLPEKRASLQSFDDAYASVRAEPGSGPPQPPAEVRLTGAPGQDRAVRWEGYDVARWHPDGTVTRTDREPPTTGEPPEATIRDTGSPDVHEVTLGDATFIQWGTTWVDAFDRTWTMPEDRALEHGVTRFDWPSATGVEGLLAYLEHRTGRRARQPS